MDVSKMLDSFPSGCLQIAQNMMEEMFSMANPWTRAMRMRCSPTGMTAGTTMAMTGIGTTMQKMATKVNGTMSRTRSTMRTLVIGTMMKNGGQMMDINKESNNLHNKKRPLPILSQLRLNSPRRSTTVAKEKESRMMAASDVAANGTWRRIAL